MKLLKPLFFYLILTSCALRGSKIEDAFKALSIYDYFKAKKLFYPELSKSHKAAAAYGLAIIFYRTDNPFSQPDSASKYITLSGNYFRSTRLQESYFNFKTDSIGIYALADSIALKCYEKALKTNTTKAFEDFILQNPYSHPVYKQYALKKRDQICFNVNQYYNSSDSTLACMLRYPQSYFYNELSLLLDKQLFEERTAQKRPDDYIDFIKNNAKNKFIGQAQDELFAIYRKNSDVQGLEFYVHNYPNTRFYNEAWKLLYALTVKSYNNTDMVNFMKAYPEFPFMASINKEIELNNKLLIPVNDSDFVGFIDTTGTFIIPPLFDAATPFNEGVAVVTKNDSAYFINKENKNVFNAFYTEAFPFYNGIAPVNKNGQWFLINRQGQEIMGPFDDLSEQSEQVYIVKTNNKYGAIDIYGNYIIQPQFDQLGDFKNGKANYLSNGVYGFINKKGVAFKARYQWISDFDDNNIAIVKFNNLYGLINTNDSLFLNARYDLIVKADNSNFILVRNNKYGFYSSKNCFISDIDNEFKKELSPAYYTNGQLYKLIKNKKQGIMDANGKIIIDFGMFDEVGFAQNNLLRVKRNNKYGFADRKLNVVIPFKYLEAADFSDSLSVCRTKTESVLIDLKGHEIYKTKGRITPVLNNWFWVEEDETNSLITRTGNVLFTNVAAYQTANNSLYDNGGHFLILEFENKSKKVLKR